MTTSHNPRSVSANPARRQWLTNALPLLGAGVAVALLPGLSRAVTHTPTPTTTPAAAACKCWPLA